MSLISVVFRLACPSSSHRRGLTRLPKQISASSSGEVNCKLQYYISFFPFFIFLLVFFIYLFIFGGGGGWSYAV
jgi:hypothetical protein